MTAVNAFNGETILIKIGNGATPEVFTVRCMINLDRGINQTASMVETNVPDCDDVSAPSWTEREKDSLSVTIDGSGVCHQNDVSFFNNWLRNKNAKNVKAFLPNGEKWSGAFHLTEFSVNGGRKQKAQAKITLMSDGEVTYA